MKICLNVALLGMLLLTSSFIQSAPDLESYGHLEQISGMSISPNGELIAYRRTESDENDSIIVFSLKEKEMIAALSVKDIDPRGHYFANNDFLILIASEHVDWRGYNRDFDISSAFSLDIKKNKLQQLVKLGESLAGKKKVAAAQGGMGRIAGRSLDGQSLYLPVYVQNDVFDRRPNRSLLEVNVSGKGKPKVVSRGTFETQSYFMDDKGNILAREQLDNSSNEHSIDVLRDGKWKTLYKYKSKILTHRFDGLNHDYSSLVFSREDDDGYFKLALDDGSIEPFSQLQANKSTNYLIKDTRGSIIGLRYSGFAPDYEFTDEKLNQRIQEIMSIYEGHSVHLTSWSADWKHIVVRVEGTLYAGDYFLFSEEREPSFLASSRYGISSEDINPIATTSYKARDGLSIPTILTLPKSKMGELSNLPTVLMPHGGPAANDQIGFDYMAQALASRGYLVIQPQFRGSTGFGKDHFEAGFGEWGKAMQDDLSDAISVLAKKGYVDPNRVCIVGASYGGYAALAGAAFTPDLFKCAVSIAGVSHIPKQLSDGKSRFGRRSWVLDYWNRSILAGDYNEEKMKAVSPYFFADKIKAPVLLLHGENDTIVEYEQSRLMHRAIKKAKGNTRLVKLKDDDHYLQNSSTRMQAVKEMTEFVIQHLGT